MIVLDGAHARAAAERGRPVSFVKNVSLTWEHGVLAVLGAPADGTTALLELLAGLLPVRGGTVLVEGKAPAESRARIAYVPLVPALPDALRVDEVCELAGQIRGEPPMTAAARMRPLGIEKLAERRVRSLSLGEARAVSLAIALSSKAPVLLIDEPLASLEASAPSRVIDALRARAAAGAAIVVTTASVREATSMADQLGVLTQGVFTHLPPALAHVGTAGAKIRVVVAANAATEVAPFVAALAGEAAIASVETAAFTATRVLHAAVAIVVSGADLLEIARAVGVAAARTGTVVASIESAVMPLDAIRARIAAPRPGVLLSRPPPAPGGSVASGAMPGPIPQARVPGGATVDRAPADAADASPPPSTPPAGTP